MTSTRRKLLIGLGSLVAGAGAVLGTGAFDTVEAERSVTVETAGDADAFLGIEPGPGGEAFVEQTEVIEVDVSSTEEGDGVNQNAVTAIDDLLTITNNGTQDVQIGFRDQYAIDEGDYDEDEVPGGWGYAVSPADDPDAAVVAWASPPAAEMEKTLSEVRPGLTTTGFGGASTLVDGRTIHNEVGKASEREVGPGETITVGLLADTRESTMDETLPSEIDDAVRLYAESDFE